MSNASLTGTRNSSNRRTEIFSGRHRPGYGLRMRTHHAAMVAAQWLTKQSKTFPINGRPGHQILDRGHVRYYNGVRKRGQGVVSSLSLDYRSWVPECFHNRRRKYRLFVLCANRACHRAVELTRRQPVLRDGGTGEIHRHMHLRSDEARC